MTSTTTPPTARAPIERTEHPHIVKSADTLSGEPRVENTRIAVRHIAGWFEGGMSTDEIVAAYAPLTLAQVHDALSYAYDHPEEMAYHEERTKLRSVLKRNDMVYIAGRLILRERLRPDDVPPGATVYTWETLPKWEDE